MLDEGPGVVSVWMTGRRLHRLPGRSRASSSILWRFLNGPGWSPGTLPIPLSAPLPTGDTLPGLPSRTSGDGQRRDRQATAPGTRVAIEGPLRAPACRGPRPSRRSRCWPPASASPRCARCCEWTLANSPATSRWSTGPATKPSRAPIFRRSSSSGVGQGPRGPRKPLTAIVFGGPLAAPTTLPFVGRRIRRPTWLSHCRARRLHLRRPGV